MSSSRLYISKLPNVSSLEVYVAHYELSTDGPALQLLKSKCREVARSDSGLLVSPTHEALRTPFGSTPELSLWIVCKAGYVKNPKTAKILSNLQLKLQKKVVLSHTILQACYHFTLVARLAPKWNRVLSWLLHGCAFLTEGKGQGIDLQVGLTNEEITVTLSVYKFSFSLMKVEDLLTTSSLLNTFRADPQCVINEGSIYNNRCFLLPNFTMGYIYSTSHFLTPGTQFQTYDQVRLHWKKQHGIILPERENLFYQVFFKGNPRRFFSYPGSCVYKNKPIHFPSRDTDQVATAFIADLHTRLPTVCGDQVRYSSRALTPYASLQPSTTQGISYANLKRLPPPKQTYTPEDIPPHLRSIPKPKQTQVVPNILIPQPFTGPRVVPIFKCKVTAPSVHKTIAPQAKPKAPIVPIFKPLSIGTNSQLLGKRQTAKNSVTEATKRPCLDPIVTTQTTVPDASQQTASQQTQSRTILKKSSHQLSTKKRAPQATTKKLSTTCTTQQLPPPHISGALNTSQSGSTTNTYQIVPDLNYSLLGELNDDFDFLPSKAPTLNKGAKHTQGNTASTGTMFPGVSPDLVKKVNKTKAASLKKWLLDNGVKCRSKEKKEDLVRMVVQHITSTGKNFELTV